MKRAEFQQIGGALLGTLCQHCKTGTPADVREVLAAGRQRLRLDLFTKAGPEGLLPLTVACLAKNVPVIEALLEAGAKVDAPNKNTATALQVCCMRPGMDDIVSMLLAAGSDPDVTSQDGHSAITVAALNGFDSYLHSILLLGGGDPNAQNTNGSTGLYCAAWAGHENCVRKLIQFGAVLNVRKDGGFTPLFCAAENNRVGCLAALLEAGAKVNAMDDRQATPLFIAAAAGNTEVVRILRGTPGVETDAARVRGGVTPLVIASELGHLGVVQELLADARPVPGVPVDPESLPRPANPLHVTDYGCTPLHIAAENGHASVCEAIINSAVGAELKKAMAVAVGATAARLRKKLHRQFVLVPVRGKRPWLHAIHLAAQNGHAEALHVLLYGRLPTAAGPPGKRLVSRGRLEKALMVACRHGHLPVVQLLLDAGVNHDCLREDNYQTPLFLAATAGHVPVAQLLCDHGANTNRIDKDGLSPLLRAIQAHCPPMVDCLLHNGCSVNYICKAERDRTPLHFAAQAGSEPSALLLLENGSNVNSQDSNLDTPLALAISANHDAVAVALLDRGADPSKEAKDGSSVLYSACKGGMASFLKRVLSSSAMVGNVKALNAVNRLDGVAPLWAAANLGAVECVTMLLEAGANPETADREGCTGLMAACRAGHIPVVRALLSRGTAAYKAASVDTFTPKMTYTALHYSATFGRAECTQLLIEAGASLNVRCTGTLVTPLQMALLGGHIEVASLLLDAGADPSYSDCERSSCFHVAIERREAAIAIRMVGLLLDRGAAFPEVLDLQRAVDGFTALYLASMLGLTDVVAALIEARADIHIRSSADATPLFVACQEGHLDVARLLIDAGQDVNATVANNFFPLFAASLAGHDAVVQLLLDRGADVNQLNRDNLNCLHAAASEGHVKVAAILLRCGIDYTVKSADDKTAVDIARKFKHTVFLSKVKPLVRLMEKEVREKGEREARQKEFDAEEV